uniref:Uncharacterized protein n=1 Tax=Arundo donax TaxID=35708 RepID=A0A0A9FMM3_ARUDO
MIFILQNNPYASAFMHFNTTCKFGWMNSNVCMLYTLVSRSIYNL